MFICGSLFRHLALAIACLAAINPGTFGAAQPKSRPNFVFLLADDLGYGDIGCFGNAIIQDACTSTGWPSGDQVGELLQPVAGLLAVAGRLPDREVPTRLGIHDWIPQNSGIHLARTEQGLGKLFQQAGYRTAHIGKWHLSSRMDGSEPTPGDHGFAHWFSTQNNAAPSHQDPTNLVRNGKPVGPLVGNSSTLLVDEAMSFLDKKDETPFLLFLWFHAPHEPIAVPKKFADFYQSLAGADAARVQRLRDAARPGDRPTTGVSRQPSN